jgi:hypothetical protein
MHVNFVKCDCDNQLAAPAMYVCSFDEQCCPWVLLMRIWYKVAEDLAYRTNCNRKWHCMLSLDRLNRCHFN